MDSEDKLTAIVMVSFFLMVVLLCTIPSKGANTNNLEYRVQALEERLNEQN